MKCEQVSADAAPALSILRPRMPAANFFKRSGIDFAPVLGIALAGLRNINHEAPLLLTEEDWHLLTEHGKLCNKVCVDARLLRAKLRV